MVDRSRLNTLIVIDTDIEIVIDIGIEISGMKT